MKFLFVLMLVISTSAYAAKTSCPDFTGTFIDESSSEVIQISQWGCVTLRVVSRISSCITFTDQLVLDGVKYPVPGSLDQFQSHSMENDVIIGDHEWSQLGQIFHTQSKMYLDANGNLMMEYGNSLRTFANAMGDGAPEVPACHH